MTAAPALASALFPRKTHWPMQCATVAALAGAIVPAGTIA
jgi:hypothetical protein